MSVVHGGGLELVDLKLIDDATKADRRISAAEQEARLAAVAFETHDSIVIHRCR